MKPEWAWSSLHDGALLLVTYGGLMAVLAAVAYFGDGEGR